MQSPFGGAAGQPLPCPHCPPCAAALRLGSANQAKPNLELPTLCGGSAAAAVKPCHEPRPQVKAMLSVPQWNCLLLQLPMRCWWGVEIDAPPPLGLAGAAPAASLHSAGINLVRRLCGWGSTLAKPVRGALGFTPSHAWLWCAAWLLRSVLPGSGSSRHQGTTMERGGSKRN